MKFFSDFVSSLITLFLQTSYYGSTLIAPNIATAILSQSMNIDVANSTTPTLLELQTTTFNDTGEFYETAQRNNHNTPPLKSYHIPGFRPGIAPVRVRGRQLMRTSSLHRLLPLR